MKKLLGLLVIGLFALTSCEKEMGNVADDCNCGTIVETNHVLANRAPNENDDITGNDPTQNDAITSDTFEVGTLWFHIDSVFQPTAAYILLKNNEGQAEWSKVENNWGSAKTVFWIVVKPNCGGELVTLMVDELEYRDAHVNNSKCY